MKKKTAIFGRFHQDENVPVPAMALHAVKRTVRWEVLGILTEREQKVLRLRFDWMML